VTSKSAHRDEIIAELRRGGLNPEECRVVEGDDRIFITHDGSDSVLLIQRMSARAEVYAIRAKIRGVDDGSSSNLHWPGVLMAVNDFGAILAF
jgi:hypothetical protein